MIAKLGMRAESVMFVCILVSLWSTGTLSAQPKDGFTAQELARAVRLAEQATQASIINILVLPPGSLEPAGIAVLTRKDFKTWHLVYVSYAKGDFRIQWVSPPIRSPFDIAGGQADFKLVFLESGVAVQFHGCARHACPYIFGILLYSITEQQTFQVEVYEEETKYSPNLLVPQNKHYKDWLDKEIRQFRPASR